MLSFKTTFSLSTFIFIKRLLSSSSLSAIRVVEARGGDKRSYPASEVRGGSREEITPCPKPQARGDG